MAEQPWDQKLTEFLKNAGDELRRTGEELRAETQRLIDEVTDPELQTRMKERIRQLGQMAKETAAEAAARVQAAFGKPRRPRKASKTSRKSKKSAAKRGARRGRRARGGRR
ncbi:MAG TPA: hypothetical protein VEJ89_10495 [Myxococcaceae bacterium]|jgi:hypothetical protein|nr:hypothetical protein [Myxococcaceae bacterium]